MNLLKTSLFIFAIFAVVELNFAGSDSELEHEADVDVSDVPTEDDDPVHSFENEKYNSFLNNLYKQVKKREYGAKVICPCHGHKKAASKARAKYEEALEKADAGTLKTGLWERAGSSLQKKSNKVTKAAKTLKKVVSKKTK